jgi:hypothetical protein
MPHARPAAAHPSVTPNISLKKYFGGWDHQLFAQRQVHPSCSTNPESEQLRSHTWVALIESVMNFRSLSDSAGSLICSGVCCSQHRECFGAQRIDLRHYHDAPIAILKPFAMQVSFIQSYLFRNASASKTKRRP